jgi:hypothetical protein
MPTRRQRRRREKTFRHEYGFVAVDEEGNEVELEGAQLRARKDAPVKAKEKTAGKAVAKGKKSGRALRDPEPASWRRSARRSLLWSPATIVLSLVVLRTLPVAVRIVIGVTYAALFVPFTYLFDGYLYRRFERRKLAEPRSGKSR